MQDKIKLIWDFRGPSAEKTAEHHQIHLNDFLKAKQMELHLTGVQQINEFHYIAFMVVEKPQLIFFRDTLKPNRAQVYKEG